MFTPEKKHKIISASISIVLIILVQFLSTPEPIFRFLLPALAIYFALVAGYVFYYLRSIGKVNWWVVIRTLLVFGSWVALFFVIPSPVLRGLFLLLGLPTIYFFMVTIGKPGEQVLFNELVIASLGSLMLLAGLSQYFVTIGSWYVLIAFALTVLICRSTLEVTPQSLRSKWLGSVVIGLCIAELFWALSFLPLHFSVLGFILFAVLYVLWSLYYYYLFNHLTLRKIQFHIGLAILFIALVVMATPWGIIS
jgi:hypothetical protein